MPNTPGENNPDTAEIDQRFLGPNGTPPPEHISMNDLGYVIHIIGNAITMISGCVTEPELQPKLQQELIQAKQITIDRINFLLKNYEEDLKNMPEFRDFLELLLDAVQNDKFENVLKLYRLGTRAFQKGALLKPGRHLSQTEMAAVQEGQEAVPELKLTVVNYCNNQAGRYVGLNKVQRDHLGVEVGGTVELFDEKDANLGLFTVGAGSREYTEEPEIFTVTPQVKIGDFLTVKKSTASPDKPREFNLHITHAVEKTVEPEKHRGRTEKNAERFPELDPDMYITLPTAVAAQLGIKPEPGKTVAPISKRTVRDASGYKVEMAIVPGGTTIGFTSDAAKELDIPKELTEIRIIIDKGVLVIG